MCQLAQVQGIGGGLGGSTGWDAWLLYVSVRSFSGGDPEEPYQGWAAWSVLGAALTST